MTKYFFAMFFFFILECGCNREKEPLGRLHASIEGFLTDNAGISEDEYMSIVAFVQANEALRNAYNKDSLLINEIRFVGLEMSKREKNPINFPFVIEDPTYVELNSRNDLHFFYENSASMDGFLNADTEFTGFILDLLSTADLKKDKVHLYYVNREAYPLDTMVIKEFEDFLKPSNVKNFGGKERGNSEINRILGIVADTILKGGNNKVAVVVSDYIYSIQGRDVSQQLSFQKATTISSLKGLAGDKYAIMVVKINSNFKGNYYDMTNNGAQINEKRPFFIWIFGEKERISKFAKRYDITKGPGYETHTTLFKGAGPIIPYYSVLAETEKKGKFKKANRKSGPITEIKGVETDRSKVIQFSIAVDLSHIATTEAYLLDSSNYKVMSSAGNTILVRKVLPITSISNNDRDYKGTATHLLVLGSDKINDKQDLQVVLSKKIPAWVSTSSTTDDTTPVGRQGKTFGFSYLVDAASEVFAYNENDHYFSLTIKIR
jgi:hypothetical protein